MEKFYSPLLYGATSQTILIILPLYKSSLFVAVKKTGSQTDCPFNTSLEKTNDEIAQMLLEITSPNVAPECRGGQKRNKAKSN